MAAREKTVQKSASTTGRWAWPVLTAALTLVLAASRLVVTPRFYFSDDTERGSAGQWWQLGDQLLQGRLPMLDPSAWQAGNYWAEGQWGLLNPVTWLIAIAARLSESPVLHATVVKLVFLVILSLGVYLLARQFGAHRPWAALAGVLVPVSGFVVYMDAASWSTDLFNVALFPWAWWALRRAVEHRRSPFPYLLVSYLLITIGYVFGVMMLVVILVETLVRHAVRRDGARVVRTLLASAWGALLTIVVYLPAVLTAPVTERGDAPFENLRFLNADLTDLASAGNPWVSATIRSWGTEATEGPLVHIAWALLLLPLALPLARSAVRRGIPLFVLGGVALVLVLGPSHMGPIRWPLRLIPYLAIVLVVVFAVGISRRYPQGATRRAFWLSGVVIGATSLLTWGNGPYAWKAILAAAAVAFAALVVLRWIARAPRVRRRAAWAAVASMAVTAVFVAGQLYFLPTSPLPSRDAPDSASALESVLPDAHGDGIVVGDAEDGWQDDASWDERLIANLWYFSPTDVSSMYTVLPFETFGDDLCIDLRGKTCEAALDTLWSVDDETGLRVSDLMGVSTIVAMKDTYPDEPEAPEGWTLAEEGEYTWLFERDEALPAAGGVVWTADGTAVSVTAQSDTEVTFTVDAAGEDGRVVLSRLPYPGYSVDGAVQVDAVRGWLLTVDVSDAAPGDSVTVSFRPPAWPLLVGSYVLALAVGAGWLVGGAILRRRRAAAREALR
ncbi:glycosyltransferase family 39 protein [Microbacterium betulae]|uniref:Glycosyltransferase family 39 protein n=1 Tax=Microbacterium betulae TaxID=2981139 RepID=A0AA97FJY5_9MICO|nr:glycosyltransferase family 39 protein [Microbacterium sp. AB]WOF24168.1 glycosyltransferase family 39 protein [Microbacterium sp. AB]